jgi:hypothetical protein
MCDYQLISIRSSKLVLLFFNSLTLIILFMASEDFTFEDIKEHLAVHLKVVLSEEVESELDEIQL